MDRIEKSVNAFFSQGTQDDTSNVPNGNASLKPES